MHLSILLILVSLGTVVALDRKAMVKLFKECAELMELYPPRLPYGLSYPSRDPIDVQLDAMVRPEAGAPTLHLICVRMQRPLPMLT